MTMRWSVQQRNVAKLRALGYTQQAAADACGVDIRTARRYETLEGWAEYVTELHARLWEHIDPQFKANVLMALSLQAAVFRGEREADDPAYLEARRLIERVMERVGQLDPGPVADNRTQVVINAGGGQLPAGT